METKGKHYNVALAGNPNVGKSTVFNALTGMKQHTGNWAGKTVGCAVGEYRFDGDVYTIYDLPGCYSLTTETGEERAARDMLCKQNADAVIVVCDASCLERNLIFALQIAEIRRNVVICVNLLDEAERKGINVDIERLSQLTFLPCVGTVARKEEGLSELLSAVKAMCEAPLDYIPPFRYPSVIEDVLGKLDDGANASFKLGNSQKNINEYIVSERYLVIRALSEMCAELSNGENSDLFTSIKAATRYFPEERRLLNTIEDTPAGILDKIENAPIGRAEFIAGKCVSASENSRARRAENALDRILLGNFSGIAVMVVLLSAILWITVQGANYPSEFLQKYLFKLQNVMYAWASSVGVLPWLLDALILGVYRILAWVVSVMLPPMAIFFPLFTLLEDLGYLPRVAFKLDPCFKKSASCGKQALTMCMGFGCNAVGVTGCRIIDSPRERLIATVTNCLVPCNGRFPTVTVLFSVFLSCGGMFGRVLPSLGLTAAICMGVFLTFAASKLLSATVLRGVPSAFTLELPPYRAPQVGKVIVRSVFDRTLFVLGRAAVVAAPAGLLIWVSANITIGDAPLLIEVSRVLEPVASLMGLDGVILLAFILSLPANEIFLPIAVMIYTQGSTVSEVSGSALQAVLFANGWSIETAICTVLFCIAHFPCATTTATVYKETRSMRITLLAVALPTVIGVTLCMLVHLCFWLIVG